MIRRSPFLLLLVLCLSSCMDSFYDYGRMNPTRQASAVFENGEVPAGYRYYINGPEGSPDAVVALAPGFTLSSRLWTEVTPDQAKLKQWAALLGRNPERQPYIRGAVLEDFKGNAVGYWYSPYPRTMVKVKNQKVEISAPEEQPTN